MNNTQTRHTPGPWQVDPTGGVQTADGHWQICGEGDWGGRISDADACLIAAAPELLAALRYCRLLLIDVDPERVYPGVQKGIAEAEATIAKAEGR